jgi:hypothetical protein
MNVYYPRIQWVSGVKPSGREADHPSPYGVEVKKVGAIPSLPHTSS